MIEWARVGPSDIDSHHQLSTPCFLRWTNALSHY